MRQNCSDQSNIVPCPVVPEHRALERPVAPDRLREGGGAYRDMCPNEWLTDPVDGPANLLPWRSIADQDSRAFILPREFKTRKVCNASSVDSLHVNLN